MLTKKERKRLTEIQEKAKQNYLDNATFYIEDWIDDDDIEEYQKLIDK